MTKDVPYKLRAPEPGWVETTDVLVIGSGVAGLTVALHLRQAGHHVMVVTKVNIDDGSTKWAQGGIAAVLDPLDTAEAHARDTLMAGVGLCDEKAVAILTTEGPARLKELIRFGAQFDRNPDGSLMLGLEGGHHANRIVHAGGDATGAEIQRALHTAVRRDPWIRMVEHALVLDLLTDPSGRAAGITLHVLGEGTEDGVGAIYARAVVLATGGLGQIFSVTTNPKVSTGDGVALALRAGAEVTDLEFVQFHPTSLYLPGTRAQQPLVSEALRGAGAYLRDGEGHRFMVGQHELAELAPRDVVAKAITWIMHAEGTRNVWLDARDVPDLEVKFPTITAYCRDAGIEPAADLIPVAPAAHYASGGVRVDLHGRTTIPGLYACGEVACTGVHGANRLASNSLLEGLVFAKRIAADIATELPPQRDPIFTATEVDIVDDAVRGELQRTMSQCAGVIRSGKSLTSGMAECADLSARHSQPRNVTWEATNLVTVASTLLRAAALREETRGCHWREDFPDDSSEFLGHIILSLNSTTWEKL